MTELPRTTAAALSIAGCRCAGLVALLLAGCTGQVAGPMNPGGNPGTGGVSGPRPDETGIIDRGSGGTSGGMPGVMPCTPGDPPLTTRIFRLTHTQYENAVRALTGLDLRPAADFPIDQNQAGFNRGMDLQVGDALGKAYRSVAEGAAAQLVADATAYQTAVG